MIFRLMAEQTKEDEHKHWCDLEVSNSEVSRDAKSTKESSLTAKINSAKANADELKLKIDDLDGDVVELMRYMNEAKELRLEGKTENALAIKDAQAAQTAIAKAAAVLTTFYKDSGSIAKESWESFLQTKDEPVVTVADLSTMTDGATELPVKPETWTSSYTGVVDPTAPGEGVLAVLESTAADFSKMEADTKAQDASDQKQFDVDMQDATVDKMKKAKEAEMKADEKTRETDKVRSMEKMRQHAEKEHGAVEQYLVDLKGTCGDDLASDSGSTKYGDRKAARDDEIAALKDAKTTLENAFKGADGSELVQIAKHA